MIENHGTNYIPDFGHNEVPIFMSQSSKTEIGENSLKFMQA